MPPRLAPPAVAPPASTRPDRGPALLAAVLVAAACAALAARAAVGLSAPLWLDESWTGAFAALASPLDLVAEMRNETGAPAYYLFAWAWARLFGTTDVALHVPCVLLGCAAPVAAWLGLRSSRPRLALVWAAALGLWGPGIVLAGYARCYALLLLASTLCCVAFLRLLDAPTRRRAFAWAMAGALVVATHYFGALMVGLQGLAWVALHRRRALAHWPAGLAFLPPLAWVAWNLPRLLAMARPEVTWIRPLAPVQLPAVAAAFAGVSLAAFLPAAVALSLLEVRLRRDPRAGGADRDAAVLITGGLALAAAVLFVALSCIRPLYASRYMTAFAPGALLLVSSRLVAASRGRADALALLAGGYALVAGSFWLGPSPFEERAFSFEAASAWLARSAPRRLAFFWDNPSSMAEDRHQLDIVGGFFLRRAGLAVDVAPVLLEPGVDMNARLLAEGEGRTAYLWLSDTHVHDTSVRIHPPRLAEAEPGLECRDFGRGFIGVLACRPRTDP